MNQKSSARPPDHGILKKELFGYTGICLVLLLLLGTGERLFDTFPVQGMLSALCYLFVGGLGMSAGMFRFRPEAERSEFFKTFTLLYHPGSLDSGGSLLSGENRNLCGAHHRKPASGLYCRMELSGGRHDRAGGDPAGQPHVT